MNSTLFTLDNKDFIKGLLVAILSSVITILYNTIQSGSLTFDWKAIGTMALTSALGYILKNLLTNSTGEFLKKDA